jgi:hypothetical protein
MTMSVQVLSIAPFEILLKRHPYGADAPEGQENLIPHTFVRVLQARHHKGVQAGAINGPTVLKPLIKQVGMAPIERGLLAEVLATTALVLHREYEVSLECEWVVIGQHGLRLPVNYGSRAGARHIL